MKRFAFGLMALLTLFCVSAQDEVQVYKIEVGQFDRLRVTDNVNVVYRCLPDSTGFVQYSGVKEFADAFILTPKGGQLRIQVSTEDVGHPDLPVLYVYSDFLTSVENSSNFTLTVENPAPCAEFKAMQVGNGTIIVENLKANKVNASLATGNGNVNISGECREAVLKMLGTGTISADRLRANKVSCKILGSGTIGCWPVETLDVKGLGSTKIYYKGDPVIKKVGGGNLFPLAGSETLDTVVNVEETYEEETAVAEDSEGDEI